jgi:hypothetical protein
VIDQQFKEHIAKVAKTDVRTVFQLELQCLRIPLCQKSIDPGLMAAWLALRRSEAMLAATNAGALRSTMDVSTSSVNCSVICHKRQ